MAGDWIKVRTGLVDAPKVIAMARALAASEPFRQWLAPAGTTPPEGPILSSAALRCVTVTLSSRVWASAREHGKFVGADLFLPHLSTTDLDVMAGAPGVGEAMVSVEWARVSFKPKGLFLPNFQEFNNSQSSHAERQKRYREKLLRDASRVTSRDASRSVISDASRVTERRGLLKPGLDTPTVNKESSTENQKPNGAQGPETATPPSGEKWWLTVQGIAQKGIELGIPPTYREEARDYKRRLFVEIEARRKLAESKPEGK